MTVRQNLWATHDIDIRQRPDARPRHSRHAPRDCRTFNRHVRDDAINSYGVVLPIRQIMSPPAGQWYCRPMKESGLTGCGN